MNTGTVIAAAALIVAVITAGVALAFSGMEPGAIVAFLTGLTVVAGGVIAVFDRVIAVLRVNTDQNDKIEVITEQTNGVLAGKIRTVVTEALNAALNGPTMSVPVLSRDEEIKKSVRSD